MNFELKKVAVISGPWQVICEAEGDFVSTMGARMMNFELKKNQWSVGFRGISERRSAVVIPKGLGFASVVAPFRSAGAGLATTANRKFYKKESGEFDAGMA